MLNVTSYYDKIAGVTFDGRQDVIKKIDKDTVVRFRREPENQYDKKAIAVDALVDKKWASIGYISAKHNRELAEIIDNGQFAAIKVSEVTGGGDHTYGVNVLIHHQKEAPIKRSENAILSKDFFGNEIFYDDVKHCYSNSLGEVYMSGSRYASNFGKPFNAGMIVNTLKKVYSDLTSSDGDAIEEMWDFKKRISGNLGTAIHEALEMYARYDFLRDKTGKSWNLYDHPTLKGIVESFYTEYPLDRFEELHHEVLVVDHSEKRCGRIDRLEFESDGVYIGDYKTNIEISKKINNYWLQLSFYARILKRNGLDVKGLRIYHYDGKEWKLHEHGVVDLEEFEKSYDPETGKGII